MLKKPMTGITPINLRIILISSIILTFAICIAGFWFFRTQLVTYALQVQSDNATAASSSDDIVKFQNLEKKLKDDTVAVTRAKNIVADSQYYQYQNQIITDINAYAKTAGVSVTAYAFSDANTAPGAAAASSSVTTPPPAGLKSITASVTLKNPVSYTAIMKFTHLIELNLTKMQLSGVSMTGAQPSADGRASAVDVTVNPITIEVYTR